MIINGINVFRENGRYIARGEGEDIIIIPVHTKEDLNEIGIDCLDSEWVTTEQVQPIMELGLAIGTMSNADGVPYSDIYRDAWS